MIVFGVLWVSLLALELGIAYEFLKHEIWHH